MRKSRRLVLISIDGLLPDGYLDPRRQNSVLSHLARAGVLARAMKPVFPSLTYTNHASLATGCTSARHGIFANTRFDPETVTSWPKGEPTEWIMDAHTIQVPTLWELAERAGFRTGLIRWPTTVGAQATWLLPEIFALKPGETTWNLIQKTSTPALLAGLKTLSDFTPPQDDHPSLDRLTAQAVRWLLKTESTDLVMAHFTAFDHEAHEHGIRSGQLEPTLKAIESHVADIVAELDLTRDTILIFGDHGFYDFDRRVNINTLFKNRGWIQNDGWNIREWKVIAHTSCSIAPVYVRDPSLTPEVLTLLEKNAGSAYRVLHRDELRDLDAFPDAICVVETNEGYSLGQDMNGELVVAIGCVRGEHGYEARTSRMMTGFLACGAGCERGRSLEMTSVLDVAPTAASLLGLSMGDTQGRMLSLQPPEGPFASQVHI